MIIDNKNTYLKEDIVEEYVSENHLQEPEKCILECLMKKGLNKMSMLDIGVGGGRTTLYFAEHVRKYVGLDYSENMINACKTRFVNKKNSIFLLGDVRDMKNIEDNTFDFILFSFNGLDYISHEDRLKALSEIHRVGKPDAYFCFSTHNLQSWNMIFGFWQQFSINPKKMLVNFYYWIQVRYIYNKNIAIGKLKNLSYTILNDGGHHFQLQTYYIYPKDQVKQLSKWFKEIKIFSLRTGKEIEEDKVLDINKDRWLYYLCKLK